MKKVAVLISGRGSNLQALLDAQGRGEFASARIALVLSNKPGVMGLQRAEAAGVPTRVLLPKDYPNRLAYDAALRDLLLGEGIDYICLAGFMRIISGTLLGAFPGRVLNIHPSLLPSFPGLDAEKQALEYGVRVTGCTVHLVDEGVDTGPILLQRAVSVLPTDTVESLSERILVEQHLAFPEALRLLTEAKLVLRGRALSIE